jgi:hypothetical protein
MKNIVASLQPIGRALMLPIAVLPPPRCCCVWDNPIC